jgi:glutamyl-tRNA reductase
MKLELISVIKNDRLQPSVTKQILKAIEGQNGKKFIITLDKYSSKRSKQQNRYLHLLFTILKEALNDFGNEFTSEEIKELCKAKFSLIEVVNENTGETLGKRIKGTSEMNKTELNEFIESIIRWAAELNIILPFPNEQIEADL